MEQNNLQACSNEELMVIFNKLNQELINRSKEYEFYYIYLTSRRYRQRCTIENDFYQQMLSLYPNYDFLHLRFDSYLHKLLKLFHSDTYLMRKVDVPLNKIPRIRNFDDGEFLNEEIIFDDSPVIFVPINYCQNMNKANEFVEKIKMISWNDIVKASVIWESEWSDYLRGKGYHMTNEMNQKNKDNPNVKRNSLTKAIFDLDISTIEELVKIHTDDKETLLQAIIDIYELATEKLIQ